MSLGAIVGRIEVDRENAATPAVVELMHFSGEYGEAWSVDVEHATGLTVDEAETLARRLLTAVTLARMPVVPEEGSAA